MPLVSDRICFNDPKIENSESVNYLISAEVLYRKYIVPQTDKIHIMCSIEYVKKILNKKINICV